MIKNRSHKKTILPNREKTADMDRPYENVGDRIKSFRLSVGLAQEDFYKGIVATQAQMSRYENGLRAPTVEVLQLLRKHGADLNFIITGE